MKRITIKTLSLTNFKGVRSLKIDFNETSTRVCGRNATGKTTLYDAFVWVLFGKDSKDRKQFDIKTLDEQGVAIPKIPHEVTAILYVDGQEITLTRRYMEKWVKKYGRTEETFEGHTEERIYNGVPISVKEWAEKIDAICPEQVFKMITSTTYFTSQKADVQRAMLFKMAGEVSDEDVAGGNKAFKALLGRLTGKTMDEYKRELRARKNRIKDEVFTIPERIDERQRDMAELEQIDFVQIKQEITDTEEQLQNVENQIMDEGAAVKAQNEKRYKQQVKISELKRELIEAEQAVRQEVLKDYYEQEMTHEKLIREHKTLQEQEKQAMRERSTTEQRIKQNQQRLDNLRAEWKRINASMFEFDENEAVCPTCKRRLDDDDVEARRAQMEANFNQSKSEMLRQRVADASIVKVAIEADESHIKDLEEQMDKAAQRRQEIEADTLYAEPQQPNEKPMIETDEKCAELRAEIAAAENILKEAVYSPSNAEDLLRDKNVLAEKLNELRAQISKQDELQRCKARIEELNKLYKQGQNELSAIEGEEATIREFGRRRIEMTEDKVNRLFGLVKFKMYNYLNDGTPVETCEAVVDGVPYSSQNNAMRINMGLDIINTICAKEGIYAPIVLDNAESCNEIIPTGSQMILLSVTDDEVLTIR